MIVPSAAQPQPFLSRIKSFSISINISDANSIRLFENIILLVVLLGLLVCEDGKGMTKVLSMKVEVYRVNYSFQ